MRGALCYGSGIGGGFNGIEVQRRKTCPSIWRPMDSITHVDRYRPEQVLHSVG